MAGINDDLGVNLNLDGFSNDKIARLNTFIDLFTQLEKFDGKVYNPIIGTGLAEFNTSIKQTSQLMTELNNKLNILQQSRSETTKSTVDAERVSQQVLKTEKEVIAVLTAEEKLNQSIARTAFERAKSELNASKITVEGRRAESEVSKRMSIDKMAEAKSITEATRQRQIETQITIALAKEQDRQSNVSRKQSAENSKQVSELQRLNAVLKQQEAHYSNLVMTLGKSAGATKSALSDYKQTGKYIDDINQSLGKSGIGLLGLGKGASTFYSYLRQIAYILPGLGIAGIFNLAFEAIGKAAEETGLFNNRIEQWNKFQVELNKGLKEQIDLSEKLLELEIKLNQEQFGATAGGKRVSELMSARGYDEVTMATKKVTEANNELALSYGNQLGTGNTVETLKKELDRRLITLEDYKTKLEVINNSLAELENPNKLSRGRVQRQLVNNRRKGIRFNKTQDPKKRIIRASKEYLEEQKKILTEKISTEEASYKSSASILEKGIAAEQNYFKTRESLAKINSDQARKLFVETAKDNIGVSIDANRKILSEETSTEKQRINALQNILKFTKQINELSRVNITGTKDNPNLSSTKNEKDIATNKENDENLKAEEQFQISVHNTRRDFYQRRIKALSEEQINEIQSEANKNKEISQNEQYSMNERLKAYISHVDATQKIQDIQYERNIQKGKENSKDKKTSLITEEQVQEYSNKIRGIVTAQASVEKDVFDIVKSSSEKRFKEIKSGYDIESNEENKNHADRLNNINLLFEKDIISVKQYKKERERIDEEFRVKEVREDIAQKRTYLEQLKKHYSYQMSLYEKFIKDYSAAEDNLTKVKKNPKSSKEDVIEAEQGLSKAKGQLDALSDSANITDKEIKSVIQQINLLLDKLGQIRLSPNPDTKFQKWMKRWGQVLDEAYKVADALITLEQTTQDTIYEKRLETVEKMRALVDEQLSHEIDAVNKSSESQKDKIALEMQLNARKEENDKKAQRETNKLRHDQAVFDKEMTIAHILLATSDAVMQALTIPPPQGEILAIERGALGAVQVAIASAQNIPSYEEGTDSHPGGLARFGEAGPELVKEPYKSEYIQLTETVSYLPKGTQVIPIRDDVANFIGEKAENNDGWEQVRWLGKQIRKSATTIENHNSVDIDLGMEYYKNKVIYGIS